MTRKILASVAIAVCVAGAAWEREGTVAAQESVAAARGGRGPAPRPPEPPSAMVNPYRITENWPLFGDIRSGAAIGIIPDGKGGTWLHHRSEPPILHIDASGNIIKRFGDKMFVQAHGFCQDRDGNFWAGDSGPFQDNPNTIGRGFQMFKFSPEGKVLLTLGKAGESKAGQDTFIGPTACAIAPNGDIVIAGRGRPPHNRTAIGSFASRKKGSSSPSSVSSARVRASSWDRTRLRSIRRAASSSRIDRTTACRSSIAA